jgi:hypothetical protein
MPNVPPPSDAWLERSRLDGMMLNGFTYGLSPQFIDRVPSLTEHFRDILSLIHPGWHRTFQRGEFTEIQT